MVALSRTIPRQQAMEMLLTGDLIDRAHRARPWAGQPSAAGRPAQRRGGRAGGEDRRQIALCAGDRQGDLLSPGRARARVAYACASQVMTTNMLARHAEAGIDAFINKQKMPPWEGR